MYRNAGLPAEVELGSTKAGAEERTRTSMGKPHQLLRLARIPIPPPRHGGKCNWFLTRGSTFLYAHDTMRIILVHGFNASPEMNFHPWLAGALRDLGHEVITPTLPLKSNEPFDRAAINQIMVSHVGVIRNNDIFLGHSLGGLLILQFLEATEMKETPRGIVLVGSPWKVAKPELRSLFMADLDSDVLMWKAREFVVVHSKDDKLVPYEHGKKLSEALRARLVTSEADDHFMGEQYPILLKTVEEMIAKPHEFAPGMSLKNDFEG